MDKPLVKKVCIVVDCLSIGGAEKSASYLSKVLTTEGHDVLLVSIRNKISYTYSGRLINLGLDESKLRQIKQLQKVLRFKKEVENYNPDIIIDYRMRNRWFMEYMIFQFVLRKYRVIYTVHNYKISYHIPSGNFFRSIYDNSQIVGVSKDIKKYLEDKRFFGNVVYIPNAIDIENIYLKSKKREEDIDMLNGNYILAVGRLYNEVKQFDKLIKCYHETNLISKGVKLYILGEGDDKDVLFKLIKKLNLEAYVKLLGFKKNPYTYIGKAKFLVLCSKHEGLPMVILEALSLKIPVVSFNCPSGPSEMIAHEENGLLIENQNFEELKKAINYLEENPSALNSMKNNTQKYLAPYFLDNQYSYWKAIL